MQKMFQPLLPRPDLRFAPPPCHHRYRTREEVSAEVFDYIERFYNRRRSRRYKEMIHVLFTIRRERALPDGI